VSRSTPKGVKIVGKSSTHQS